MSDQTDLGYTFKLCKEDGSFIGWSRAKDRPEDKPGLTWTPWEDGDEELMAATEAAELPAAEAQASINAAQNKVIGRLAHDMAILFKRIKAKGFVAPTVTEKKWLDDFLADYDDWIAKQEA